MKKKLFFILFLLPTIVFSKSYCIYINQFPFNYENKRKIYSILHDVAYPSMKIYNNYITLYSGKFKSFDDASKLLPLTRYHYKNAKVSLCDDAQKYRGEALFDLDQKEAEVVTPKVNVTLQSKVQIPKNVEVPYKDINKFSIRELDEKGYIPIEIASSMQSNQNSKIEKSNGRYLFNSQKEEYLNGLYLKTDTAYDLHNKESVYDVKLEFDMFQQGYFQNKKKNERNKIVFYKTLKSIEIIKKDQEFLRIKNYENSVHVSALLLKLHLIDINRNKALSKMKNGTLTEYKYQGYLVAIQQIKDKLLLFRNRKLLKIPRDVWYLLNQVERVRLVDKARLMKRLQKDSIALKLATTLQKSKPLSTGWSDKLRVNFYVGLRKIYLSENQTLVGVEAKIPLFNYSKREELNTLQNRMMSEELQLQHVQSQEKLRDAIATFKYEQQKIKTDSFELVRIKQHIKNLESMKSSDYASYVNISYDSKQKSDLRYLQKYTQTQLERITAYKELINIMYIIHSNNIDDILSYAIE